jgi:hypothetical protein
MIRARTFGFGLLAFALFTLAADAQTGAHYRDYQLGSGLASVSTLTGMAQSEAKTVHERPAVLQELEWRRPYTFSDTGLATPDPVARIAFSFYNDQLFRLVIDYDRDRTGGMTDADMVEAISEIYGATVKPLTKTSMALAEVEKESGTPVARWGDAVYSAVLYRASFASGFRMIVTSVPLGAQARKAETQAVLLDEREAPQRELAKQKKDTEDARAAEQKARVANKAAFNP